MTTHKEALKQAYAVFCSMSMTDDLSDMADAIRAYMDARGLVMVPREPTPEMVDLGAREVDWYVHNAGAAYAAMLAAAPDPFK